jgi:hypothetical protein
LDRLEKATRALDRERLALKKAEALAVAATRRAAEAESASRETLTRAETLERLNVEAEARAECLANDLRDLRNRAAAEATERLRNSRDVHQDVPKTSSCHEDDAKKSSVMVEVRVAPDADELLAREAAASRLKAEAEAISSASARLVEKLVRENGALVERLERMQSYDASTHETSLDTRVTNTAYSSRETSPVLSKRAEIFRRLARRKRLRRRKTTFLRKSLKSPRDRAGCGRSSPAPTARRRSTSLDEPPTRSEPRRRFFFGVAEFGATTERAVERSDAECDVTVTSSRVALSVTSYIIASLSSTASLSHHTIRRSITQRPTASQLTAPRRTGW